MFIVTFHSTAKLLVLKKKDWASLYSYQLCLKCLFSVHLCQRFVTSQFVNIGILFNFDCLLIFMYTLIVAGISLFLSCTLWWFEQKWHDFPVSSEITNSEQLLFYKKQKGRQTFLRICSLVAGEEKNSWSSCLWLSCLYF